MVVPVLGRHQGRHAETGHGAQGRHRHALLLLHPFRDPADERGHAQADPDAEGVERARIGIVALAHLVRRLVQVEDDRDAGHEEEQEHQPAAPLVAGELEEQAQQAQQQRQQVIMVLAFVVAQGGRRVVLVAQAQLVQRTDAALPVAEEQVVGRLPVDVVLPAGEIPHEITPVHPVQLVVEEEGQIGAHRGLLVVGARHTLALAVHIGLIILDGLRVGAPHAREEHLARRLVLRVHRALHPLVLAVQRRPVRTVLQVVGRIEILPVQERRAAVLLTRQVTHQGEGVVGLVFVGRGLDGGTDDHDAEQRESDHDRRQA